jgi:hypothetical protein
MLAVFLDYSFLFAPSVFSFVDLDLNTLDQSYIEVVSVLLIFLVVRVVFSVLFVFVLCLVPNVTCIWIVNPRLPLHFSLVLIIVINTVIVTAGTFEP